MHKHLYTFILLDFFFEGEGLPVLFLASRGYTFKFGLYEKYIYLLFTYYF